VSSMWKRKESSQAKQDSREQKWFRIIIRSFSAIKKRTVSRGFSINAIISSALHEQISKLNYVGKLGAM
jgi:hypothetical protein